MSNLHYLKEVYFRVTLLDPDTSDYKDLYFNIYDINLAHRWLEEFNRISENRAIKTANVNFSKGDLEKLKTKINSCIKKINKFYDIRIDLIKEVNHNSMNVLHEHYAVYGERLKEKLDSKWWDTAHEIIKKDSPEAFVWPGIKFNEDMHYSFIELNNLVHKSEIILANEPTEEIPGFIVSASFDEKNDYDFKETDIQYLKPILDFGDLCLGYNTLGKNLRHIVDDFDLSSLDKNLIYPQKTWSNEFFISLQHSDNNPFWFQEYYKKWKDLDVDKFGFKFGDFFTNNEGYYCIGRLCSQQINELYDYGSGLIKQDLSNFSQLFDAILISQEQFEIEINDKNRRIPLWSKPRQRLDDTKINKIINGKQVIITWILNNVCNYSCRYCPPNLHDGKNFKIEWEEIKGFVDHLIETYSVDNKTISFSLSGGEPTMSPFFPELIKRIYDAGHICRLTTNLSRTSRFIEENFKYLFSVSCSFHPYYEFKNKTSDQYLEKLKVASKETIVTLRIMMDPLYWNESIEFIERVRQETWVYVEPVMIENQYGGYIEKLSDIQYTEDQLEWFKNFKFIRINKEPSDHNYNKNEIFKKFKGEVLLEYDNGEVEFTSEFQKLINNGQTKFFKYKCNAGKDSLYIAPEGEIKKANCHVGGVWGKRQEWQTIKWDKVTTPVICSQLECSCGADIPITKYKFE